MGAHSGAIISLVCAAVHLPPHYPTCPDSICVGRGEGLLLDTLRLGVGDQSLPEIASLQSPEALVASLTAAGFQSVDATVRRTPNLRVPTSCGNGEPLTQEPKICLLAPQYL